MPSEYDALLEQPPTQQKSEYDALLTEPAAQPKPPSGGVLSGIGAGIWRAIPKNLSQIAGLIGAGGKSDIQELLQTGRIIGDVVGGKSPEEAVRKEAPDVAQQQDVLMGKYGTREQAAGITGLGIQAATLALPFLKSLRGIAFGKVEEPLAAETAATQEVIKNATEPTEPAPTQSQIAKANVEAAPVTQQAPVERLPSLLRSAEEERRTAQDQAPKVREALSLDELRLMRERNELQLQNDISRRVSGGTHPAVDERIGQIDEELTNIANRELQQQGGGGISAKSISEDEARNAERIRQEEGTAGGGGDVEQAPQGNRPYGGEGTQVAPVSEGGEAPAAAGQPKIESLVSQVEKMPTSRWAGYDFTDAEKAAILEREAKEAKTEGGVPSEEERKGQDEGQKGRVLEGEAGAATPAAPTPETPEQLGEALKERPRTAGVANRVLQERAARGEIPQAPESGEGHLTEDIINKSRAEYSPERALAASENVKAGSLSEADAGQVRIHEEALTKTAADAERALDADPKNPVLQEAYNKSKADLTQWHNETVQPMKTTWSNAGKSMQGETNIDTGSYIGLQKLAWDTAKRDFTPQEEPIMRTAAKKVNKATEDVRAAIASAEDQVQKVLKPSKFMDLNQLRESLAEKLKSITC